MNLNDDLLRKGVQEQIDSALQEIEQDYRAIPGQMSSQNGIYLWVRIWEYCYGSCKILPL
jgi:hypothetical protein